MATLRQTTGWNKMSVLLFSVVIVRCLTDERIPDAVVIPGVDDHVGSGNKSILSPSEKILEVEIPANQIKNETAEDDILPLLGDSNDEQLKYNASISKGARGPWFVGMWTVDRCMQDRFSWRCDFQRAIVGGSDRQQVWDLLRFNVGKDSLKIGSAADYLKPNSEANSMRDDQKTNFHLRIHIVINEPSATNFYNAFWYGMIAGVLISFLFLALLAACFDGSSTSENPGGKGSQSGRPLAHYATTTTTTLT